jgi:hypothetical protein
VTLVASTVLAADLEGRAQYLDRRKKGRVRRQLSLSPPPLPFSFIPASKQEVRDSFQGSNSVFSATKNAFAGYNFPRNIFSFVLVEAKAEPTSVEFSRPIFCMHLIFSPCLLSVAVTSYNYFNAKCCPARYEAVTKQYFEEFHLKMC